MSTTDLSPDLDLDLARGPGAAGEGTLAAVDGLLRAPDAVLDRIDAGDDLELRVRAYAATLCATTAVMGATLGSFRGGWQILFAAVKLPLVALLTAALVTPAFVAARRVLQGAADPRREAARVLACMALAGLLVSATAPVLLLAMALGADYHATTLLTVACCGLAGLGAAALGRRVLRRGPATGRWTLGALVLIVGALAGTQLSWTLRPYLVRPRTEAVPFVRAVEGSFIEAVGLSLDSVRGRYHRPRAPLPGRQP